MASPLGTVPCSRTVVRAARGDLIVPDQRTLGSRPLRCMGACGDIPWHLTDSPCLSHCSFRASGGWMTTQLRQQTRLMRFSIKASHKLCRHRWESYPQGTAQQQQGVAQIPKQRPLQQDGHPRDRMPFGEAPTMDLISGPRRPRGHEGLSQALGDSTTGGAAWLLSTAQRASVPQVAAKGTSTPTGRKNPSPFPLTTRVSSARTDPSAFDDSLGVLPEPLRPADRLSLVTPEPIFGGDCRQSIGSDPRIAVCDESRLCRENSCPSSLP